MTFYVFVGVRICTAPYPAGATKCVSQQNIYEDSEQQMTSSIKVNI